MYFHCYKKPIRIRHLPHLNKSRRISMKINDNYLKEQLQHVYWLNGGC